MILPIHAIDGDPIRWKKYAEFAYDTELLPKNNTPQQIKLFVRGFGLPMEHSDVLKTITHTNFSCGLKLPIARQSDIRIIGILHESLAAREDERISVSDFMEVLGGPSTECERCNMIFLQEKIEYVRVKRRKNPTGIRCPFCKSGQDLLIGASDNTCQLEMSVNNRIFMRTELLRVPIRNPIPDYLCFSKDALIRKSEEMSVTLRWARPPQLENDVLIRIAFPCYMPE